MDSYIVDYLNSGKAWVLIGSGPSIEMGYPTWHQLAELALQLVKSEASATSYKIANAALQRGDFPLVFQESFESISAQRTLAHLRASLQSSRSARIYRLLAKWPIPVYLTTNFDNEIPNQLAEIGESYITYSNSRDHINLLSQDFSGAIFKLHGDLSSETGLILTSS